MSSREWSCEIRVCSRSVRKKKSCVETLLQLV